MKILAYPGSSNARQFRLDSVGKYIERSSQNSFYISLDAMNDNDLSNADVIILQQTIGPQKIKWVREYSATKNKLFVAEVDDGFILNPDNRRKKEFEEGEGERWLEVLCGVSDVVTTTTDYLAKDIKRRLKRNKVKKDVVVLPNYLDMEIWDLPILRNYSDEVRIVWAGSDSHRNDLEFLAPIMKRVAKKYPQVKFILCGYPTMGKLFDGVPLENVGGVSFGVWPSLLHSFRADIAVAPLLDTEFNRCKSNLKYLEYGVCALPGVYSDVVYSETIKEGETGFIAKTPDEFFEKISLLVERKDIRDKVGANAYLDVKTNYDLKDHASKWLNTYWYHLSKKKPLKIDAGSGIQPIVGAEYVHLDANPNCGEIVVDITEGIPVADGTVKRLRCSAIIEHIYIHDLEEKILPEFWRILKDGGSLYVALPDWKKIKKSDNWEMIQQNLYGAYHDYIPAKYDLHKNVWDFEHLKELLEGAGFKEVKEIPYTEGAHDPKFTLAVECVK